VIADLPWHVLLRYIMLALSFLMVSNVPYPVMPNVSLRSVRGVIGFCIVIGSVAALIFLPSQFFFPAAVIYVAFGILRGTWLGLLDRRGASPTTHTGHMMTPARSRVVREEVGDDRRDRPRRRRSRKRRGGGGPRPNAPSTPTSPPESTNE
jgi:CDP-diacylglycerol--serine O-phosphatidyltransferase